MYTRMDWGQPLSTCPQNQDNPRFYITTSDCSNAAILEASREGASQVELVDGDKLVEMFQRMELGVFKRTVYDVYPAYFEKFKYRLLTLPFT
jgi:restriction endonuclease Mrr